MRDLEFGLPVAEHLFEWPISGQRQLQPKAFPAPPPPLPQPRVLLKHNDPLIASPRPLPPPLPLPSAAPASPTAAYRPGQAKDNQHQKTLHVLHIFSGPSEGGGTFAEILRTLGKQRRRRVIVREVDWTNCHCSDEDAQAQRRFCTEDKRRKCENLLRDSVYSELRAECEAGHYDCIIAGIPCNSFCKARFEADDNGARPLRDREHPYGLANLSAAARRSLATNNELTRRSLELTAAVWGSGGEVLIENPPDYAVWGLWSTDPVTGISGMNERRREPRHCPLWHLPWVQLLISFTGARELNFVRDLTCVEPSHPNRTTEPG